MNAFNLHNIKLSLSEDTFKRLSHRVGDVVE